MTGVETYMRFHVVDCSVRLLYIVYSWYSMQEVKSDLEKLPLPWQCLGGPEHLTIGRNGEIKCEVESRSWQLEKDIEVGSGAVDGRYIKCEYSHSMVHFLFK